MSINKNLHTYFNMPLDLYMNEADNADVLDTCKNMTVLHKGLCLALWRDKLTLQDGIILVYYQLSATCTDCLTSLPVPVVGKAAAQSHCSMERRSAPPPAPYHLQNSSRVSRTRISKMDCRAKHSETQLQASKWVRRTSHVFCYWCFFRCFSKSLSKALMLWQISITLAKSC